jgi:hypothetical protein
MRADHTSYPQRARAGRARLSHVPANSTVGKLTPSRARSEFGREGSTERRTSRVPPATTPARHVLAVGLADFSDPDSNAPSDGIHPLLPFSLPGFRQSVVAEFSLRPGDRLQHDAAAETVSGQSLDWHSHCFQRGSHRGSLPQHGPLVGAHQSLVPAIGEAPR